MMAFAVPEFQALEMSLSGHRLRIETALPRLLDKDRTDAVAAAIGASLLAPAKRLRPILALLVAETLGADAEPVVPAACAIEMVHTASLILDDLPSMDDAQTRRGRPACHVEFGEATALLAAFALLSRAYELLAQGWSGGANAALRARIAAELGAAVGLDGMIAGQAADLALTGRTLDLKTLEFIHSRKTGALFIASATLGAVAAGASDAERAAIAAYAKNLGLAFQVVDDIIDIEGGSEAGKDTGKDQGKTTFVSLCGTDGAKMLARELVAASLEALAALPTRADRLRDLARYVAARRK
jgi:geranylgeranyl pyrophosphate synthase